MKQYTFLLILSLVFMSIARPGFSQAETSTKQYKITSTELLLNKKYYFELKQFYQRWGEEGTFKGEKNVDIYYKIFKQPEVEKGAVLISSGRTEAAFKYKEVIYDLWNNGYSVYIHDHRGQGLSGRMADDPEMGYVDDYQYYIDDMKTFYDDFLVPNKHKKTYLLSHSLGGAVAMNYLEQFPNDFTAATFSSPMLGLASYICPLAKILNSKTPKYAPGQGGYNNDSTKFATNVVTGSETRFYIKIAENNEVLESRLGGASVQWLHQSCRMMKAASKNMSKIETPILIFTAENESVVNPKATEKFVKRAQSKGLDCRMYKVMDAQHEILMEKDAQREEMFVEMLQSWEK